MGITGRPLRGSRLSSFYPQAPAEGPSLTDLDSAFQLQEYIALLIRRNPHDVETIVSYPGPVKPWGKADDNVDKDGKEVVVDQNCWIYEQLRRLAQDLTHPLITTLQTECNRSSCPEMKAGEWLYLCVAHGNEGAMEQCCAIDYIIHTLDSATALLNSPRAFPSRLSIPQASIRHFASLARRLGRIFAHAYFHHRDAFETAEAESGLYARFLALTERFELVPPEFLVIPPRSSNHENSSESEGDADPPRLRGADPNPPLLSQNLETQSINESPRKVGRNRTDTMVFSDAEAFSEALRSSSSGLTAEKSALGFDNLDNEKEEEENDIANTGSSEDSETKPYTLSFSASGTMKTALPPGVSPSTSNVVLTDPSGNANNAISGVLGRQTDDSRLEDENESRNENKPENERILELFARKHFLEISEFMRRPQDSQIEVEKEAEDWEPEDEPEYSGDSLQISVDEDDEQAPEENQERGASTEYILIGNNEENDHNPTSEPAETDSPVIIQSEEPEKLSEAETSPEQEAKTEELDTQASTGSEPEPEPESKSTPDSAPATQLDNENDHTSDEVDVKPTPEENDNTEEVQEAETTDEEPAESTEAPQETSTPPKEEEEEEKSKEDKPTPKEASDSADQVDPNISLESDIEDVEKALQQD